jgi:acyl-CoA oxidase
MRPKILLNQFKNESGRPTTADQITTPDLTGIAQGADLPVKLGHDHLRERHFYWEVFRLREAGTMRSCRHELQRLLTNSELDAYSASIQIQQPLVGLAFAYVERMVLDCFIEAIERVEIDSLKPVLGRLCDLFAISQIEQNAGWYMENGILSGHESQAITKLVDTICRELRPDAVALVDSFGIPDACLAAPIGL